MGYRATLGAIVLGARIVTLEKQLQLEEERLKALEFELLGRLLTPYGPGQTAFASAEPSSKRLSVLEQDVVCLLGRLSDAVPTPSVHVESRHASVRKNLAPFSDSIGKLRGEVKTGREHMDHNQCRSSDQYFRAVDERLKVESNRRREVLP